MKTIFVRKEDRAPRWHLVDASGLVLGRLAARVSRVLQGKHRASYTPHVDTGDFVVVINASQVKITGRKLEQESYFHHTGYLGGLRQVSWGKVFSSRPEKLIQMAVKRMLPKTRLGKKMFKKLKVYAGSEHEHSAQQPVPLELAREKAG